MWCDLDWKTRKIYLGTNKEVSDTELYTIGEIKGIAMKNGQVGRETGRQQSKSHRTRIHTWANFQAAFKSLQDRAPCPGQWLAKHINGKAQQLVEHGTAVEIHLMSDQKGVEGNKRADEAAKEAVEIVSIERCLE